jgi:hypothetical protein
MSGPRPIFVGWLVDIELPRVVAVRSDVMQENKHSRWKQIGPDKPERVQDAAPPTPFTPEQDWTLRRRFESYCTGTSSQAFIAEFRRRKHRSQGRYDAAS